ncbi:MAG: class I SAM-dependent methyltransferase [Myxococcota bacterium]
MRGPVYWHPALYKLAMRRLYGKSGFEERYRVVAAHVPPGSDVIDLCAGDGRLRRYLPPGTPYLAVDTNEVFLRKLWRQGVATLHADLRRQLPCGGTVVMMASLYHFMPEHVEMVRRALQAATRRLILTEPVENVTASRVGPLARLSAWISDPGDGSSRGRLNGDDLSALLAAVPGGRVVHKAREWVLVWDK